MERIRPLNTLSTTHPGVPIIDNEVERYQSRLNVFYAYQRGGSLDPSLAFNRENIGKLINPERDYAFEVRNIATRNQNRKQNPVLPEWYARRLNIVDQPEEKIPTLEEFLDSQARMLLEKDLAVARKFTGGVDIVKVENKGTNNEIRTSIKVTLADLIYEEEICLAQAREREDKDLVYPLITTDTKKNRELVAA